MNFVKIKNFYSPKEIHIHKHTHIYIYIYICTYIYIYVYVYICLQSFPALGSFTMSHLLWGGPSIGAEASVLVLPMNSQGWFLLGLTGLISLLSKGLSRVFSSTTVWKHQFLGTQPSLWANSHILTWLLEKP